MDDPRPDVDRTTNPYEDDFDEPTKPQSEDGDTPYSEPSDETSDPALDLNAREQINELDPTHPATDSAGDIDAQQLYDEGLSGASEAAEPNSGNAVVNFDPRHDDTDIRNA